VNSQSSEAQKQNEADNSADKVPSIQRDPSSVANVPSSDTENQTANKPDWQRKHIGHALLILALVLAGLVVLAYFFTFACAPL
jgi:flagellar biosynthesis/type III secretory pathway M-ring protein FliF/YscJ